ncbi:MAG: acetate--CoA ligase family protein [Candidatus Pacebacteria bacterium]|nr:acetate--CoA ligase family protein [Candidatus Paceibacterota bacterium]
MLNLEKTLELLKQYDIPFVQTRKVKNLSEVFSFVNKYRYPVVLKIFSQKILHKTDKGGVYINLKTKEETENAFLKLKNKFPSADILIQKHIPGIYLIAGAKNDKTFGPTILFGLGGIFVEILKSTTIRLAPVSIAEIKKLIKKNAGYPIISGARGQKSINFKKLERIMFNLSKMISSEKNIREIDINPLVANDKEIIAVDVKIIV